MMKWVFAGFSLALGVAGSGCADNGHDVGFIGVSNAGGNGALSGTGGSAGKGGVYSGDGGAGSVQGGAGGGAGSGASEASGGKQGSGGERSDAGGSGGARILLDSGVETGGPLMCGSTYCLSTLCNGLGCGLARCCQTDAEPGCVHGATRCPGEPAQATLKCWSTSAALTTTFDKTCTTDTDCIVAEHWNGCCSASVIGLKASEQQAFDAFEQTCGGSPACGCCCDQVYAEDGYAVVAPARAHAMCWGGACMAVGPSPS